MLGRMTNQDLTLLSFGMVGIGMHLRQGVLKHGSGLLEGYAVLLDIGSRLRRVPFEGWSVHEQASA